MLISYTFSNFCSFKDEFTFSMKPGRYMQRFSDNTICINEKNRLLKTAVIVGENGGGKTSFFSSIEFLQYMFINSDNISSIKSLINFNSLENDEISQKFLITIFVNNLFYTYELIIDNISIVYEKLRCHKINSTNEIVIFHSKRLNCNKKDIVEEGKKAKEYEAEYEIGLNDSVFEKNIKDKFESNFTFDRRLSITKLALIEDTYIKPFVDWIKDTLIIESPSKASLALYRQLKKEESDIKILKKESYLELLKLIDSSIVSIKIDEEKPFEDSEIYRSTDDNKKFGIKISKESSGIKEYFAWAIHIWRVINENKVVFADEMDRVLNPILAEKIITYIHGKEHSGQFIFSTHNVLHLNTVNFMKEQMWFVTKSKSNLSSKLYSLADFADFRYDKTNIYELYLKGILGGTSYD